MSLPPCPQCNSQYTYEDNGMYICPECAHEWSATAVAAGEQKAESGGELRVTGPEQAESEFAAREDGRIGRERALGVNRHEGQREQRQAQIGREIGRAHV